MCEYIDKQSVTSMPLLDQLVESKMVKFPSHGRVLSFDERDHIMRESCDGLHPSVSLALDRLVCCYCFLHDLYKVPTTMRLCNSRLPKEHFVCYQTSQHNWVIIKVLYRCLRRCLLGWHRSRIGFVTPCFEEVSLGPLGNAHHYKPCKQCGQ